VRSDRIDASTAPNTEANTTEDAIDPDWSLATSVADEPLRDDGLVRRLVAGQVRRDRAVPVDVPRLGPAAAGGAVQRPGHRGPGPVRDPALDLGDHSRHHGPGGGLGRLGHEVVEAEQRPHQVHVRLDRLQHLLFQQEPPQAEPVDRVTLHDLHDR
jgi:hypothetical protein